MEHVHTKTMAEAYSPTKSSHGADDSDTDLELYRPALNSAAWFKSKSPLRSAKTSKYIRYAGMLAASVCVSVFTALLVGHGAPSSTAATHNDLSLDSITNSTLGFHKIYSVSLPRHWHKRDGQLLAARHTGLDIENVGGVRWEDIPKSEYPLWWHDPYEASIGCWRAHMNILAKIVEEGIGSALILEDDADWDVSLKPQLQEFARGAIQLQKQGSKSHKALSVSPYGDSWDFLWVGGCSYEQPKHDNQYYLIHGDHTVAPLHHRHTSFDGPDKIKRMNNTRTVFQAGYGTCTTGYAVTQDSARRMLASISLPPNVEESAIDRKFGRMCAHMDREMPMQCYGVYPALFSMHRFAGLASQDSDIVDHSQEDKVHDEYTYDIVYSTMMNLVPLAMGAKTYRAQWPQEAAEPDLPIDKTFQWKGKVMFIDPAEE